jgi:hypothetical protein
MDSLDDIIILGLPAQNWLLLALAVILVYLAIKSLSSTTRP